MIADSVWAKWYVFANGGGIGEVMVSDVATCECAMVPQDGEVQAWDRSKLTELEMELGFIVLWLLRYLVHWAFTKKEMQV
jgi:hypothetical protein